MKKKVVFDEKYFLQGIKKNDIVALSKLISLIESNKLDHNKLVVNILNKSKRKKSYILGVSGTPGAGKSTFINLLGLHFLKKFSKRKIAVLPIDPSSEITGGSILGDKTRMGELTSEKNVYIRPVASKGSLGGVTPKINLMIDALMVWGYDFIIIETVGVGQSESSVRKYVKDLILVVPPATGDDLQGMKRGILEIIDAVCVNKIDLFSENQVQSSVNHYQSSLSILQNRNVPIFTCSLNSDQKNNENFFQWIFLRFEKFFSEKSKTSVLTHKYKKISAENILVDKFLIWFDKKFKSDKNMQLDKMSDNDLVNEFIKNTKIKDN